MRPTSAMARLIVFLLAFTTAASAQTTGNDGYLQIIDSNARIIGPFIPFSNLAIITINQKLYGANINKDRFDMRNDYFFLFATTDCTGTPYLENGDIIPVVFVLSNGRMYFPGAPFSTMTMKSFLNYPPGDRSKNCHLLTNSSKPIAVGHVGSIALTSLGFSPPFTVRLAPRP